MEGIQKHKGRGDPRRLGRIEIGRSNRRVKGDDELSLRLALRSGVHTTKHDDYAYNEPHKSVIQHTHTSSCPLVCTPLRVMTIKVRSPSAASPGIVGRPRGPVNTIFRTCTPPTPGCLRRPRDELSMRLRGYTAAGEEVGVPRYSWIALAWALCRTSCAATRSAGTVRTLSRDGLTS